MHDARKAWHLGDILTLTTGFIFSPRENGHRALEEYLVDRPLEPVERMLVTPQLREAVFLQFPELRDFQLNGPLPEELWHEWLRRRIAEFGEFLPVMRLPSDHPLRAKGFRSASAGGNDPNAATASSATS